MRTRDPSRRRQSHGPDRRHTGAAWVASGLPADRRTCNWWAASVLAAAVVPAGHQRKSPAGKPLVAKPKTLAVVNQDLQRRRRPVAEHEHPAAERIVLEHLFAHPGQAVDPLAKIGRLDGHHHPHLRRDLDHDRRIPEAPAQRRQVGRLDALEMDPHLRPGASSNSSVHWQEPDPRGRGQFEKT